LSSISGRRIKMKNVPSPRVESPGEGVQPPLVYVYDEPSWEYKHRVVRIGTDELLGEEELNVLGSEGWELVGVVTASSDAHFYFKRRKE
jgi:hypothetical protein